MSSITRGYDSSFYLSKMIKNCRRNDNMRVSDGNAIHQDSSTSGTLNARKRQLHLTTVSSTKRSYQNWPHLRCMVENWRSNHQKRAWMCMVAVWADVLLSRICFGPCLEKCPTISGIPTVTETSTCLPGPGGTLNGRWTQSHPTPVTSAQRRHRNWPRLRRTVERRRSYGPNPFRVRVLSQHEPWLANPNPNRSIGTD
jgi:hypothetical protein